MYAYDDIIELQHQLTQNRIEAGLEKDRYVARIAKVRQQKKDIETFLKDGYSPMEISVIAQIPLAVFENHVTEIRRHEEAMARYPIDGFPEGDGGYFAILQS